VFLHHPKHAIPQVLILTTIRVLFSFFRLSQLGLLVGVFSSMLLDVSVFIVIYFILLVSCTFLFIGIATPELLNKGCKVNEDFEHSSGPMTCEVCISVCARARIHLSFRTVLAHSTMFTHRALTVRLSART
jgi:hypothetical protein